jgi:hypothetical protein
MDEPSIDRRLELEIARLKFERQKAAIELSIKRRELAAPKTGLRTLFANPLTLAIVGGFITLMTSVVTTHLSAKDGLAAEAVRARDQLEGDLIEKFVDNPSPQKVRANLQFLVTVGLVPDYAESLDKFLKENSDNALPSLSSDAASMLQTVHTPTDAIDLVMDMEGGYTENPNDPSSPYNFGIGLPRMSQYLGRTATKEDIKNLSRQTARAIYAKFYMTGNVPAISSPQVTAAYLNLADNMGTPVAVRLFDAAVSDIDHGPTGDDRKLSASTVQRMNSMDPDLLIETVNCGAAKIYDGIIYAPGRAYLIGRLRKFSPHNLQGVCPELATDIGQSDSSQSATEK